MGEKPEKRSHKQIVDDLDRISPLAVAQYLEECEFYDRQDAQEVLDEAVAKFEEGGGVAGQLGEAVTVSLVNSCSLLLLKKFHEATYRKVVKGKISIANIVKQCREFEYPLVPSKPANDAQPFVHDRLRRDASEIDHDYNQENYRDKTQVTKDNPEGNRNTQFKNQQFDNNGEATDVTGRKVHTRESAPKNADGKPMRSKVGEADHITPLKTIHDQHGSFIRRYSDEESMKRIVNRDENFQLLAGDTNAAKGGGKTNEEFIGYVEKIDKATELSKKPRDQWTQEEEKAWRDLDLNDTQKKAASKIANQEKLSSDERESLEKYKLSKKAKENLRKKQAEAERDLKKQLLTSGAKTVAIEWVGKLAETLVGPIAFEIRDAMRNGLSAGFEPGTNAFEAIVKRLWRILAYMAREIPRLLGDLLGDLSQMLLTFFMTCCKVIKDFLGKLLDIVVAGIGVLVEAVKVLLSPNMSGAAKGNAIAKIVVGFVTGALGAFVIDKALNALGLPDPFSEVAAALASGLVASVVMYYFDKVDIFNVKREVRLQRIQEIFAERCRQMREDIGKFDLSATEALKAQRKRFEELRGGIDAALNGGDFEELNSKLDECTSFFQVDIPYASTEEFVRFVRSNPEISIARDATLAH